MEGPFNKLRSFSFIRLWDNVVYKVEKIINGQTSRLETSIFQFTKYLPEFYIDRNIFLTDPSYRVSTVLYDFSFDGSEARS